MYDDLKFELADGICMIDFVKVDGTKRLMKCTLKQAYIQEHERHYDKKTERIKPSNENLLVVFDVEKNDWRSLRLDSIVTWNVV